MTTTNAMTYGGKLLVLSGELVVRRERREAAGYREDPRKPELAVDGRTFPLDRLREIVVGHFKYNNQTTRDVYPVYAVLDDFVVEVVIYERQTSSCEVGDALAAAAQVPVGTRHTGQMVGMGASVATALIVLMQIAAVIGATGYLVTESGGSPSSFFVAPAVLAVAILISNLLFSRIGAATLRASVDWVVEERLLRVR